MPIESKSSYRSSSWAGATAPIYIQAINADGSLGKSYVFDCYFSIDTDSELRKTQHPVQTGGNISDHAFLVPTRISLDIGMSDAGVSFDSSMWSGGAASKSVQAYNVLQQLQQSRTFINLTTRLGTFKNLLVARVTPRETAKTTAGLRCSVSLEQVFLVSISAQVVSARSANTTLASQGFLNTLPVPPTVSANNATPVSSQTGETKNSYTSTKSSTQSGFINSVKTIDSRFLRQDFGKID